MTDVTMLPRIQPYRPRHDLDQLAAAPGFWARAHLCRLARVQLLDQVNRLRAADSKAT